MKILAVSILALGAAFASPALANEAVHNGLRVAVATIEPSTNADSHALTGALSAAFSADRGVATDPARSAFSGK